MRPSRLYRVAAVLLLLFAVAHTLGFSQSDPSWNVGLLVRLMKSTHFPVLGFQRTYWDFFLAAGYSAGALYLFSALLAWQLGSCPAGVLAKLGLVRGAFAACFAVVAVVSWRYLFVVPIAFSTAIAACLAAAAAEKSRTERFD